MAYNSGYNPDALPAHAEPEQVAQMLGSMQMSGNHNPSHKPLPGRPTSSSHISPHPHPQRISVSGSPHNSHPSNAPHHAPQSQNHNARPLSSHNHNRPHPLHPSPPPQNYGFGPPPSQPSRNRPPAPHPQSPVPPPLSAPSDDPQQLFPLFRAANLSHSGSLTEMELGSALVNGDYTSFHPRTVKVMVRMFDRNGNGTINFDEFVSLWRYLAAWRELFDRFDEDRSGRISLHEFENALVAFGYRLSPKFISIIFKTFESKTRQRNLPQKSTPQNGMSFDLFVQACISLKRMTDVFKRYDDDRDGYITVSFEEFLTEFILLQD
ncbi:hypothetical protein N7495_009428 [Penicillium taxi]|uniref:uncharacterized protein n=1 Tax=Penicillium taxi TaxID=168475 RepID=UPI002544F18B|nr:uncharacterized protein N7495_009428 [Penicillium taxi]KAJ5884918.1 hypothetical protein N7495_009428 [Penicillium taxi]